MSLVHMNDEPGFQWAAYNNPQSGYAKICINHESMWFQVLEDLGDGKFKGQLDNQPFLPENMHFELGQAVTFSPTPD